jgi:hypothetical protein
MQLYLQQLKWSIVTMGCFLMFNELLQSRVRLLVRSRCILQGIFQCQLEDLLFQQQELLYVEA